MIQEVTSVFVVRNGFYPQNRGLRRCWEGTEQWAPAPSTCRTDSMAKLAAAIAQDSIYGLRGAFWGGCWSQVLFTDPFVQKLNRWARPELISLSPLYVLQLWSMDVRELSSDQYSVHLQPCFLTSVIYRDRIFKLLRSPWIDSKESFSPAYVAWRAGTITSLLLGS